MSEEKQNCMNCGNRINTDECVVKKVFSQNFKNAGAKYKRSIYIDKSDENDCAYWKQFSNIHDGAAS